MSDSGIWTRGLAYAGAVTLTPPVVWALASAFPGRGARLDAHDDTRYGRLERSSQLVAIVAVWTALFFAISRGVPNTPWLLGYALGWLVIAPITLIALATLPRGVAVWAEFWRFHERRHRISLGLLVHYMHCCSCSALSRPSCCSRAKTPNQAMQLTASKPAVYAWSVCRRERMLRFMHRGLAAADLVSR